MRKIIFSALAVITLTASCSAASNEADRPTQAESPAVPTSPVVPTFTSETEWQVAVQDEISAVSGWDSEQIVVIGKAFCKDMDKKPRVDAAAYDRAMEILLEEGGTLEGEREASQQFLTSAIAQFCPEYLPGLQQYLGS